MMALSPNVQSALEIDRLQFSWPGSSKALLQVPELKIAQGEHLFIEGPSGSGKSTLLNLLSGILLPQQGSIRLLGQDLAEMKNAQRDRFRADHLGIIFQQFNLLTYLTPIENILLSLQASPQKAAKVENASREAQALLAQLGLSSVQNNSHSLSVGQQQRVAAARALIGKPEIILADEPTSALDSDHRHRFIEQLFQTAASANASIIFVSHDHSLKSHFEHSFRLTPAAEGNDGI
ncbi:ATP-binding cassette domain-containing protein [Thiomicrorhabdus sp.]|uniref:ATP-binding cassette domain-containing protein n=1 Tax=Thiomicrorhabdus sp. TaxID=2039724 RepID=UPI0029C9829F|nr:ATP-binding cassette domain-containing protein [Thiomicrorhabdus sp.]